MIIVMRAEATEDQIQLVISTLLENGLDAHRSTGSTRTVIGAVGTPSRPIDERSYQQMPGVQQAVRIAVPYKLAGRAFRPEGTVIQIGQVRIGGPEIVMMAGPCAVENSFQVNQVAEAVKRHGAKILRGGAFKPRTSPYSFQGLQEEGLRLLRRAADDHGLLAVTEVMDSSQIEVVSEFADILQVGARNMQNFALLTGLGKTRKPVLLKRGMSSTLEELLLSAEYIMAGGNHEVILCERGIRTFETHTRNTMDISAIPILKSLSHLPVFADPSHGTGLRDKVIPMARAAVAAGADGLLVEVHHDPEKALSDGPQSLYPEQFAALMGQLRLITPAVGRKLPTN
jgi:3-deoxy-7-phosphoheptulonate synthase